MNQYYDAAEHLQTEMDLCRATLEKERILYSKGMPEPNYTTLK